MKKLFALTAPAVMTILFTLLFYHQSIGLNLLLFDMAIVPVALWIAGKMPSGVPGWVLTASIAVTAVFTFFHASCFVIAMNVISLLLWTGWLILPEGRSLLSLTGLALTNLILGPFRGINDMLLSMGGSGRSGLRLKKAAYFILPLFLIFFFTMIYAASNPHFDNLIWEIMKYPVKWLDALIRIIDIPLFMTILFGLFVSMLFIFPEGAADIAAWDRSLPEILSRRRRKEPCRRRMTGLKDQHRAGIFLLAMLNLLIMVQNALDIWYVWLHFEWNGQYLRQFVHEGTWLLMFSILISIAIILWLYRGNLNFLPGSRLLRWLSYAWLAQNVVLAVSVAVRNGWYIHYYALAYLRVGVFIFLAIVFVGIVTVMIKVHRKKTLFYLLRINSLWVFVVLVTASCVNWDTLIARYNFAHYRQSFVHLDWLQTLSDKALPYLDKSPEELAGIKQVQDRSFQFDYRYMQPEDYRKEIDCRKKEFLRKWECRGWLSFNLADYRAYQYLKQIK